MRPGGGSFFFPRTRGIPRHLKDGRYMTLLRVVAGGEIPWRFGIVSYFLGNSFVCSWFFTGKSSSRWWRWWRWLDSDFPQKLVLWSQYISTGRRSTSFGQKWEDHTVLLNPESVHGFASLVYARRHTRRVVGEKWRKIFQAPRKNSGMLYLVRNFRDLQGWCNYFCFGASVFVGPHSGLEG